MAKTKKVAKTEEDAINQIMSIVREATRKVAEEVTFRMQSAYEKCIDSFYEDYKNPKYYDRSYSLYLGSSGALDWTKCIIENKKGFIGGIEVDDENARFILEAEGNPYRANEVAWVFDRAFVEGIHGMTPEEVTEATWLKPDKATPFYRYYLRKKNGKPWQKEPMSRPPYEDMEKAKMKIYKELDSISKTELDKAFSKFG